MKTTLFIGLTLAVATTANGQLFPERDPADVNGDGVINAVDMAAVLGKWGPAPQPWAIVLERCPDPNVVTDEKLREAIAGTGLPWRVRDIGTGIEMLLVPPGTFMMGCSPSDQSGCDSNEFPVHEVSLTQPFYLGRYEVTQAQWTGVMGNNPSQFQGQADSAVRPVETVSWNLIQEFNAATGLRLPTEAEWEFACRGGTTTAFNNGSDDEATLTELAWTTANAEGATKPVGQKAPNAIGLHDMHGNVWESVSDWMGAYQSTPQTDPIGPTTGSTKVLRGGSWSWGVGYRSSTREIGGYPPQLGDYWAGFRVARTP
jgi:formylglycine-generating enzyme required for sulfatase activity